MLEYLARHAGKVVSRTRAARARLGRELRRARPTSSTSTSATCEEARAALRPPADPHGPRRGIRAGARDETADPRPADGLVRGAARGDHRGPRRLPRPAAAEPSCRRRVDRERAPQLRPDRDGYAQEGAGVPRVSPTVLPRERSAAQVLDAAGRVLVDLRRRRSRAGRWSARRARADALAGERASSHGHARAGEERYRALVAPVERTGSAACSSSPSRSGVERVGRTGCSCFCCWPGPRPCWPRRRRLGLARKALRPVQRMTSKAEEIGIDRLARADRRAAHRRRDRPSRGDAQRDARSPRAGSQEKHRLIADASHELRTPLAAMRAELDVSLRTDDLPPDARAVLDSAREEVDQMSRTVDNLLTLARVDEGRLELLKTRGRPARARSRGRGRCGRWQPRRSCSWRSTVRTATARADPQRLHQALTNFVENAIKFVPAGRRSARRHLARNGEVGVTVKRQRARASPPTRARTSSIASTASTRRARRDNGGSGLGLSICREIAGAHGGRVWVDSEEGEGQRVLAGPAAAAGLAPVASCGLSLRPPAPRR